MNEIVNKLLLVGDKFMFEMHLRQPGVTYSTCGPFKKNTKVKNMSDQQSKITFSRQYLGYRLC